jgi:sulfur carrier protein ThiS
VGLFHFRNSKQENLMKVKVLCLGRAAKEIEVSEGTTVEQAIMQAGFPKESSYTRHLNGSPCFDSDVVVVI